jgi:hypothetical protein
MAASSTGVTVSTSTDSPASGPTVALGGTEAINANATANRTATCGHPGFGVHSIMSTVDVFDGATGLWSQAALSSARLYLASTSLLGIALFAGGFNGLPPYGNAVHLFYAFCA